MTSALAGSRPLLRVALRQDARAIAPWVLLISALSASSVLAYAFIFPDAEDRASLARTLGANPALSLIFGPARDLSTADGFNSWRAGQLGAFFAGLMGIVIVIRNSRADEDSGRAELLASGVMARGTRLAVAVQLAAIASVALGIVCSVLTIACGGGVAATLTLAASFTASGLMFAGVAAITAQLGSDSRTASGLAVGTLGVLYVLRGYIDSSDAPDGVTWLTPLGWLQQAGPGTENDPRPLLLALALAAIAVAVAFVLQSRRDFGQGVVAGRPGPAQAGLTRTVWGLTLALHRGALTAWLVAFTTLGLILGTLASSIGDVVAENPAMAEILASGGAGTNLTFAFLVTMLQIIAIIVAVMGVQVVLRIYTEETAFRLEPLLAGSLRRGTYLAAAVVTAGVASAVAMLLAGTGLGLVASRQDETVAFTDVLAQAAVTVVPVWVLVGVAVATVGAYPRLRLAAWGGVVASFGLTILGPTFNLPDAVLGISPLRHVPDVTAADAGGSGLLALLGVAAVLHVVGFLGFRRRDIG